MSTVEAPAADVEAVALDGFRARYGPGPGRPIAVVIAAFDEESTVAEVVRSVPPRLAGFDTDCIVIDDGSSDSTLAEAAAGGALVCRFAGNLGQGRALRAGYRLAAERDARVIVTLDADGQFDPAEAERLVAPVVSGHADFVNGSRRLGRSESADPVRRAGVVIFSRLVSALTGTRITDPANGFRAFRPDVVACVPLHQPQYQTAELLIGAIAAGFRVIEVPVTVFERRAGDSKKGANLLYGARFGRVVIGSWRRSRRLRMTRAPARAAGPPAAG